MPRTIDDAIRDANRKGLAIHNLFQMSDGTWRACIKVFGATHELAVNPIYLNYADGDDPAECIDRAIASSNKIPWKEKAALGVEAMANGKGCVATLWPENRPEIQARKEAHWNRPETSDSPPRRQLGTLDLEAKRHTSPRAKRSFDDLL